MSFSETRAQVCPCATSACGAIASHSFIAPHSSASKCPKEIQRSRSGGSSRASASRTTGNIRRSPVWNSSGSSPRTRKWLKVMPAGGAMSGTCADRRKMPVGDFVDPGLHGGVPSSLERGVHDVLEGGAGRSAR